MPVSRQESERSCIFVFGLSILALFTIFQLDIWNLQQCCIFFSFYILFESGNLTEIPLTDEYDNASGTSYLLGLMLWRNYLHLTLWRTFLHLTLWRTYFSFCVMENIFISYVMEKFLHLYQLWRKFLHLTLWRTILNLTLLFTSYIMEKIIANSDCLWYLQTLLTSLVMENISTSYIMEKISTYYFMENIFTSYVMEKMF